MDTMGILTPNSFKKDLNRVYIAILIFIAIILVFQNLNRKAIQNTANNVSVLKTMTQDMIRTQEAKIDSLNSLIKSEIATLVLISAHIADVEEKIDAIPNKYKPIKQTIHVTNNIDSLLTIAMKR